MSDRLPIPPVVGAWYSLPLVTEGHLPSPDGDDGEGVDDMEVGTDDVGVLTGVEDAGVARVAGGRSRDDAAADDTGMTTVPSSWKARRPPHAGKLGRCGAILFLTKRSRG